MKKLISCEAAIEEIARRDTTDGTIKVYSGLEIVKILNALPAVDAVRVIRCEDCYHFTPNNAEEGDWSGWCDEHKETVQGYDFCSQGEKDG